MKKQNLLVILPNLPYPLSAGGNQAMFNGISAIKDAVNVSVVYLEYYNRRNDKKRKELQNILGVEIIPFVYNHRKGFRRKFYWFFDQIATRLHLKKDPDYSFEHLDAEFKPAPFEYVEFLKKIIAEKSIDLVQLEMIPCLPLVLSLPQNLKKVFIHHELRYIVNELRLKSIGYNEYRNAYLNYTKTIEFGLLNLCDAIITLSETDKSKLTKDGVSTPIYTSFAVVNTTSTNEKYTESPIELSFVGPAHHNPNYLGLKWFFENCWGNLLSKNSNYRLKIIGSWPDEKRNEFLSQYNNIKFCGFVDNLNNELQGTIMIVPITVGSGIRMKILEAATLGVPFVSTCIGAEGLPFESGKDCFKTDDAIKFVDSIIKLSNIELCNNFIQNAMAKVKEFYSIEALKENRLEIYRNLCQ